MNRILLLSIFSFSVAVAACSGGDGGNSNSSSPSAASTERIVYLADQDINDVSELYLVGSSIKLNPPLSQGKNVLDFQITPDKTAVVYRADQDTNDVFELYRVEFAHPGVSTKLNRLLPTGGDVSLFYEITADSSSVVYVADQTTNDVYELYRVPFVTPGVSTKLNGPLVPGGDVAPVLDLSSSASFLAALARKRSESFQSTSHSNSIASASFAITPDNSAVVYLATEDTANTIELYRVPLATPGVSTKLNAVLPSDANVFSFTIAPDGASVVYDVLQHVPPAPPSFSDLRSDLYRVSFATPGESTQLNPPLEASAPSFLTFIGNIAITPDSSAVVYILGDPGYDFRLLYRVPFATPGQSTRLNGSGADAFISDFAIRPDSSGVVYRGHASPRVGDDVKGTHLYLVPFTTPGVSTMLSGPLVAGGLVQSFAIAPDNSSVVYVEGPTTFTPPTVPISELYRVPFATPGVSTKLNGPLAAGGTVFRLLNPPGLEVTPDSSAVLYRASQTTAGVFELYRVPFATPGVSSKLNGALTSGGDVTDAIVQ